MIAICSGVKLLDKELRSVVKRDTASLSTASGNVVVAGTVVTNSSMASLRYVQTKASPPSLRRALIRGLGMVSTTVAAALQPSRIVINGTAMSHMVGPGKDGDGGEAVGGEAVGGEAVGGEAVGRRLTTPSWYLEDSDLGGSVTGPAMTVVTGGVASK
jgi:hypothetical protein